MGGFVGIDEGEDFFCSAGEDDAGHFDTVEGEVDVVEVAAGDGTAEEFGDGFPVCAG